MTTKIEWCDEVWNPVTGCTKISEGCQNCYAERMAKRLAGRCGYPKNDPFKPTYQIERINQPLHWKKPRKIFVCSMGDLFHERIDVDSSIYSHIFSVIKKCPQHIFMILTKRPSKMKWVCERLWLNDLPKNIWLGVTAENQQRADERIPILLQIPAKVRFISVEPMLGPVHLKLIRFNPCNHRGCLNHITHPCEGCGYQAGKLPIDWVICGGESGPKARPMHPDWVRSLRVQCQESGTPFFFKQWGEWCQALQTITLFRMDKKTSYDFKGKLPVFKIGKNKAGRLLDGQTWDQWPEV